RPGPFSGLVRVAGAADGLYVARPAAIPGYVQPGASRTGHHLLWRRQLSPLLAGAAGWLLALDHGRGLVQPGVGIELADQTQSATPPGGEARRLVRIVVAIADQHEPPGPEPAEQHAAELSQQVLRGLVPAAGLEVVLLTAVQRHQHGQGPRPFGE